MERPAGDAPIQAPPELPTVDPAVAERFVQPADAIHITRRADGTTPAGEKERQARKAAADEARRERVAKADRAAAGAKPAVLAGERTWTCPRSGCGAEFSTPRGLRVHRTLRHH